MKKLKPGHKILFYASHGIKGIIGEAQVEGVEFLTPNETLEKYVFGSGFESVVEWRKAIEQLYDNFEDLSLFWVEKVEEVQQKDTLSYSEE